MNKTLKWILYILLGLVILSVLAGLIAMLFGGYGYGWLRFGAPMMNHMRFFYSPIRSVFGGLFCLGVILLVVVGIVALVYALTNGNKQTQVTPPVQIPTPVHPCSNCGKPAQEDWKTCPYCGNTLVAE